MAIISAREHDRESMRQSRQDLPCSNFDQTVANDLDVLEEAASEGELSIRVR